MKNNIIYKEKRTSTGIFGLLLFFTIAIVVFFGFQLIYGTVGSNPSPNWFRALFIALFILLTINFRHIEIKLTDEYIKVSYGIFSKTLNWVDIIDCEADEKNQFYGWGIRVGRYKKQWVQVYNVIGGPRVVFLTGKKTPKGLIISTKNSQEILNIAKRKISTQ